VVVDVDVDVNLDDLCCCDIDVGAAATAATAPTAGIRTIATSIGSYSAATVAGFQSTTVTVINFRGFGRGGSTASSANITETCKIALAPTAMATPRFTTLGPSCPPARCPSPPTDSGDTCGGFDDTSECMRRTS
jgi:hypothetical protein